LIVTADAVHGLAASAWIGSLALILLAGRAIQDAEVGRELFAAQIRAFSPVAIVCVGALVSMGVVLSWTHLTSVSDFWTMNYGRILSAKIFLAGAVFLAGFINWRRGVPALAAEAAS